MNTVNTAAQNDDVVQLKCTWPDHRYRVDCRARLAGSPDSDKTVVLTNPDGRLRFPEAGDTTETLILPQNGDWRNFEISGESRSDSLDDAIIEAHLDTATGILLGEEDATVFYFDNKSINITPGGAYIALFGVYTAFPPPAVSYSVSARIRPEGVDCSVPQITNLRISMTQNLISSVRTKTWDTPRIRWRTGISPGTQVTVSKMYRRTLTLSGRLQDSAAGHDPLYEAVAAGAMNEPIGCPGGGNATTNDTPPTSMPPQWEIDAISDAGGTVVGRVVYSNLVNVTMDDQFVAWTVVFNTETDRICALRQRHWSLDVNSAGSGVQQASVDSGETDPTMKPVTGPPYPNDEAGNPRNWTEGGHGSETQTFTR